MRPGGIVVSPPTGRRHRSIKQREGMEGFPSSQLLSSLTRSRQNVVQPLRNLAIERAEKFKS